MKRHLLLGGLLSIVLLEGCSFAPDYQAPQAEDAQAYKEAGDWTEATPQDDVPRGAWWKAFRDPQLDTLEDQVTLSNQSLKVALAEYDQAHANAAAARTAYFPTINGGAGVTREKNSRTVADSPPVATYNDYTLGADLSYEVDLWGRVRNTVAANEDQAEASAADLAGVDLSLHAEMASDYIALRGDDEAQTILDDTVRADQKAVDLTRQRYEGGASAEADLDQAETQLENAKTQATDIRLQRAQLEHAIAILIGKAPANFTLAAAPLKTTTPHTEPGLPSTLLERRPDIAAAERRVAAANAEIGVARAAYFPTVNLTSGIGYESASTGKLLMAPSLFWSLGPSAMVPLFDAGRIGDLTDEARAGYEAAAASYRQTVLTSYQEVEDNLAALHHLRDEEKTATAAEAAAKRSLSQANDLYAGGATTFLDVVVAQNLALQAQLATVNIKIRRLTASVELIRALGGGWQKT